MGTIYSAADLAIIAAAGDTPAHGLPGFSSTLRRPIHHVEVDGIHIYVIPHIAGSRDILDSRWATRAWTFQEGFLSRRRLVLTDRQAIFVCDTRTLYEAPTISLLYAHRDPDFAYLREELLLENCLPRRELDWRWAGFSPTTSGTSRARTYLESYCSRHLRFDGDALDAIQGALNTLAPEGVHHLWGMPLTFGKTSPPIQLYLLWHHLFGSSSRRRSKFPSWSPIGWTESISWAKQRSASFESVHIICEGGKVNLSGPQMLLDFWNHSCGQKLVLELPTMRFTVFSGRSQPSRMENAVVALPYDKSTYVGWMVDWDVSLDELRGVPSVKGALIPSNSRADHYVMLMWPHDGHYERIGLVDLHHPRKTSDTSFTPSYQAGTKTQLKDHRWPDVDRYNWWRKYFKEETIILG